MSAADDTGNTWVFGYGSLMWRPGFAFRRTLPALLRGYHRSFCVYSRHWRGTPDRPGLVLGLAPGGECRGVAFEVDRAEWSWVRAYLDERELVAYAYVARNLPVEVDGRTVDAYTFVADPGHPHYAGELPAERAAEIILRAEGVAGLNREYLIQTVRRMRRDGYAEEPLQILLDHVERLTGILDAGSGI